MTAPLDLIIAHQLTELERDFDISGELGRGGMAVVYRATERQTGRAVALKLLRPEMISDPEALPRLEREASLVQRVVHPRIVRLYRFIALPPYGACLVMQLAPGGTLKQRLLRDGQLPLNMVQSILADLITALAAAHEQGVVHRDVKPDNVYFDEHGRALLGDFGIARSDDADTLTLTGSAIGTPAYMAPEQIDGVRAGPAADLYSFGLVAWALVTGQAPWAGESLYTVILRQKHEPLPPMGDFRRDVPVSLRRAIEWCLEKAPADRPANASVLVAQFGGTTGGDAVVARGGDQQVARPVTNEAAPSSPATGPATNSDETIAIRPRLASITPSGTAVAAKTSKGPNLGALGLVAAGVFMLALAVFWPRGGGNRRATAAGTSSVERPEVPSLSPSRIVSGPLIAGVPTGRGFGDGEFARIPAGEFRMGSSDGLYDERPVRTVRISAFELQRTEVTQGQWKEVMEVNPSKFSSCGDQCPVESVTWDEVQRFLQRLSAKYPGTGYRLPTEAEWEYAARAGTTGAYNVDGQAVEALGWFRTNAEGATHAVAQRRKNAWGVYDMHGNVWEWVQDWYARYPSQAQTDPTGPSTGSSRVLRGGSWNHLAINARSAYRDNYTPSTWADYIGFRLARTQ